MEEKRMPSRGEMYKIYVEKSKEASLKQQQKEIEQKKAKQNKEKTK